MSYLSNKIEKLRAISDHVLVCDMNFDGRKLSSGIVLLGDDGKSDGIRPRWAKVYAVGPEQQDVFEGQYVLVAHGRWTRGNKIEINNEELTIRRIDPKDILLVSNEQPNDDTLSTAI